MIRILGALALLTVGTAHAQTVAEQPEISRLSPVEGKICHLSQQIVVIRCIRGTTIVCEEPGAPVHFRCTGGVAVPISAPVVNDPPTAVHPTTVERVQTVIVRRETGHPTGHRRSHYHRKPAPFQSFFNLLLGHH